MKHLLLLCAVCLLLACEKTISIETMQQPNSLVVEGQIETGTGPIVALSKSLNYFSEIDTALINASYVHGAKVTISDGSRSVQLRESSAIQGNIRVYYYTNPQTSQGIIGANGKTYTLTIETGGQTYQSTTTIPQLLKKVDSIWWKPAPANPDTTKAVLMARVTDPPGFGNYIRYFTRVNREGFYPGYNSVYDDQITDGITYDIQVDQGVSKNEAQKQQFDERGYFKRGDTVTLKHCNIDKASFDFWRTWEFSYQSIGNPFSSPGKVIGNISNGALGSFCGYAVEMKSLIIPK